MIKVFLDFETRSALNLKLVGSWKYAGHHSTSVNCMAYKIGDGEIKIWYRGQSFPQELQDAILQEDCEVHAWNAQFERHVWERCQIPQLGWPAVKFEQWRCTAAKSAYSNHPRALDPASALLLPDGMGKNMIGHKLMLSMAAPRKWTKKEIKAGCSGQWIEDPISMGLLGVYCMQDVEAEYDTDKVLPKWPESEIIVWQVNERVCDRGVPFDRQLCESANYILDKTNAELSDRISAKTNGVITTGDQIKRIKEFINERGVNVSGVDKDIVEWLLEGRSPYELDDDVKDVLKLRQIAAGSAAKKFRSAVDVMDEDARGRSLFMYCGASATGRFASLKTQIQNMKHGADTTGRFLDVVNSRDMERMHLIYGDAIIGELGKNVRSMVCAPEGYTLVRCDSSQIECRVLHWLAGNEKMLDLFRAGLDPYLVFASLVFNREIKRGDPERKLGKEAILGLGFGMGKTRFQAQVFEKTGEVITEKFAKMVIDMYRNDNPLIPRYWKNLEAAAKACVTRRQTTRVGRIAFAMWKDYLVTRLPGGRHQFYYRPEFVSEGRDVRFMFTSPRGVRYEWAGGLLCENIVQATARDTLVYYMRLAEEAGLRVVAHIHDELMCEVKVEEAETAKQTLLDCFASSLPWMEGLPCAAEATIWRRYAD